MSVNGLRERAETLLDQAVEAADHRHARRLRAEADELLEQADVDAALEALETVERVIGAVSLDRLPVLLERVDRSAARARLRMRLRR